MRGMETDYKEETICFYRSAKAGSLFCLFFCGSVSKMPLSMSRQGKKQFAKHERLNFMCLTLVFLNVFSSMLFSSSIIKKQPNEREAAPNKIGVMYPPVLSLEAEMSAYLF